MRSGNTDDEAGLPEWFYFHNTHTNASMYFALPDLRGEKEILYRNLWRKEQDEIREQKFQTGELKRPGPADERPQLTSYQFEHIEEFVKKFEDPATQKKFYGYESYSSSISRDSEGDSDYYNEQALEIIHKIINLGQVISVEPNADIRIAIMDAWAKFERGQTISCLPSAYQDYRFRVESKIPFETESLAEHSSDLAKSVEEQVLRGRELNGEPRNLDF
jgi:hypothetical protein